MDTTPPPSSDNPLVEGSSPGTLRALRDRAHAALTEQRERMQHLEQQLSQQLQAVAEELAADSERAGEPSEGAADAATEAREALARERADWEAEQALADAQLTQRLEDLSSRLADLAAREEQFEQRQAAAASQEQELAERAAAVEQQQQSVAAAESELCERRDEFDRQREEQESRLAEDRESLAAERTAFEQQQQQAAEDVDGRVAELTAQLEAQAAAHRAEVETVRRELDEQIEACQRLGDELDTHQTELSEVRAQLAAAEASRADAEAAWAEQQATLTQANEQLARELTELGGQLAEQNQSWEQQREELIAERDQLAAERDEARAQASAGEDFAERAARLDAVEKKFELAVEDLRILRERNAELEQELARRPEQAESESSELVSLRQERDSLLARIEELENAPPATDGAGGGEELADLERRFEMAVDDVRRLRQENESLAEQLAAAEQRGSAVAAADDSGDMGWEAQKRRLLASLEDEGGDVPAERVEERLKIEGTIRITDDIVAAKDREIKELQRKLDERPATEPAAAHPTVDDELQAAIDADEVIRQHREKLASLEEELTEKLRQAELELSVERAKLAREQSALAERQIELEKLRDSLPQSSGSGAATLSGRGRWFSKLGLGGDES